MDAEWIITVFVVIDDLMTKHAHKTDSRADVPDSEIVTIAVCAAKFCQNHHARTVLLMGQLGYLSGTLSVSRFNRRLHALADWVEYALAVLMELFCKGELFILDSMPLPVCRRVRARRCGKVRGREYCGYCAAKDEKFFGWRLHLIVTPTGVTVNFTLLPASFHDLTPIHELSYLLPPWCRVLGDKAYNACADEATIWEEVRVRFVPIRKSNRQPNTYEERLTLRQHRENIEAVNSQLNRMGIQRLYARTNGGFELKVRASLLALSFSNSDAD
jgi:hypothetical protein